MIRLDLPYPPSANRYWRTRVVQPRPRGDGYTFAELLHDLINKRPVNQERVRAATDMPAPFVNTYVSSEAKTFKELVAWTAKAAGIVKPFEGRIEIAYSLHPQLPQDWRTRQRKDPDGWTDTVRCLDLGNTEKVLSDAMNGVIFDDDKWVRKITIQRGDPIPDGGLVVFVAPVKSQVTQATLELA